MSFYTNIIRPVLFRTDPEMIHYRVFRWLKIIFKIPGASAISKKLFSINDSRLHRNIFGLDFPNPVGLAAGFDKDAKMFSELSDLGFGFIEIGTVTPVGQPGNDKPRMFRLPADTALINRMGFNNDGVLAAAQRLKSNHRKVIIGGNIGKNKNTPNENAKDDYEICFRELFLYVDYFVVNVSSPNTPGLRSLQEKGPLLEILLLLQKINSDLSQTHSGEKNSTRKPILLKIAPDLSNEQLDEIIEVVLTSRLDGIIATNTTLSRENLNTPKKQIDEAGSGGLSGKPLTQRSTEVIRYLSQRSEKRFNIIGVGGIHSADDAMEKLNAGADLIQLYTGFIYEGPSLIKKINRKLIESANQHISQLAN